MTLVLFAATFITLSGCDSEFTTPDKTLRITIPSGMVRGDVASAPAGLPSGATVLGAFRGKGAALVIVRQPPSEWEKEAISADPRQRLDYWMNRLPFKVDDRREIHCNGRRVIALQHAGEDDTRKLTAATTLDEDVILLTFQADSDRFEHWQPRFESSIATLVISDLTGDDYGATQTKLQPVPAGLFTGLWHGLTWGSRACWAIFEDIDPRSDQSNGPLYGTGYVIGFIIQLPFVLYVLLLGILVVIRLLVVVMPQKYVLTNFSSSSYSIDEEK